jgi:long-chain acyl-CoA synthetase
MANDSFRSVPELFQHRVKSTPNAEAISFRDESDAWATWTWHDVADRVRSIACGLRSLGLQDEERCAILSGTRAEWILADLGVLSGGGATTTIYPSNTPAECAYILNDSDSNYVFAEDVTQLEKLLEVRGELAGVRKVILIAGDHPSDWVVTLEKLMEEGDAWDEANGGQFQAISDAIGPESLATLIYTSGTTGKPKGVMLTHDCWVFEGETIEQLGLMMPSDKQFIFLPFAHSFAKVLEIMFIRVGVPTAIDGDLTRIVENLGEIRPTFMGAVPRIFEKVYNATIQAAKDGGPLKYRIFKWALRVGKRVSVLRQQGKPIGPILSLKHGVADRLVFSKLKAKLGGRIRYFISGGAPLAPEIAEFFHAAGILILEGYGLTESSAASFCNRPDSYKFGTVGPPLPGVSVKLADDGEILISGRGIMKGYYNLDDATKEALIDGWLHTGDIGTLDSDGFLKITDRKKDIIVTAGGKNVAPQNLENSLKAQCPYVSQVVVHGDKRNFLSALLTLNTESTEKWAASEGLALTGYASLAQSPQVRALIQSAIDRLNADLASYETIKKFAILPRELTIEDGELTPKMSIKRRVVETEYRDVLAGFYAGTVTGM